LDIDVEFSDEDRRRLAAALGREDDVDAVAELVARAGAAELLAVATGRAVPSTVTELRAFRILYLLQKGMSLGDAEALVASIFKVPSSTAKRYVSEAVARFKVELHEGVTAEVVRLLDNASWDPAGTQWQVQVPSMFVRDGILDALSRSPLPDPVRAQRGPVWTFADETYQELRRQFGLNTKPPPE
jgi:hypothetical protein